MPAYSQKGSTTIILILAGFILLIAVSIYFANIFISAGEKAGRDNKRKADIDAMAKALEVHYLSGVGTCPGQSTASSQFTYCPLQDDWFKSPSKVPQSPEQGGITKYCLKSVVTEGGMETPQNWTTNCPVGWIEPKVGEPPINTKAWKICTSLETVKKPFCLSNQL